MDNRTFAGDFWTTINTDTLFDHIVQARELIEEQTDIDFEEFVACISRETTPLYHKHRVMPLRLLMSQQQPTLHWPKPANVVAISRITDNILKPTFTWLPDVDFTLSGDIIEFHEDPFAKIVTQPIYSDNNQVIDTAIGLWCHNVDTTATYLKDLWGMAIGVEAESSEAYRALLVLMYEAMIGGTSQDHIERIVELFYGPGCTFYPGHAEIPNDVLKWLTLPKEILDPYIGEDLMFPNGDVPLICKDDQLLFSVGGFQHAVPRFFELLNTRKTKDGRQLRDLLTGDTINPCHFVQKNVLRHNTIICVPKTGRTPDLADLNLAHVLRLLMPPHTLLIIAR